MNLLKILSEVPTIEAKSIRLRKLKEEDAAELLQYYSNANVYRYLDWNGPETIERAAEAIKIWNRGFEDGWILRFAIAQKETDKVIGTIFLNSFEGKRAEVGYELSESYWRKGIMSEALHEVLSLGFHKLGLTRIQAFVCEDNAASTVLLKKFGFRQEGYLRQYECHHVTGECKDMLLYALLKEEFEVDNFK